MIKQNFDEVLISIYANLAQHHGIIGGAPPLSMTTPTLNDNMALIQSELEKNMAYLLGLPLDKMKVKLMLKSIEKNYKNDDFWRRLLLSYTEYLHDKETTEVRAQQEAVKKQLMDTLQELMAVRRNKQKIIDDFASKLKAKNYPIDGKRLFKNYLNYADKHPEEAWDLVTTNPAFFSPIKARDNKGKILLKPSAAIAINKEIGAYIKKIKG